jgi:hypothetical protein
MKLEVFQSIALLAQTIILFISAIFVWRYSKEAKKLRESTQEQLKILKDNYTADLKIKSRSFIDLSLRIEKDNNHIKLITKIFNDTTVNHPLDYAFLLITQQDSNIIEQSNILLNNFETDNILELTTNLDIFKKHIADKAFKNKNVVVISLPFYYSEHNRIADENPGFSYILDNYNSNLDKGIYTVRFFVFPKSENKYHRSTADSFIID